MPPRSETVIAAYRPKPGKANVLRQLVREHQRTLSAARLVAEKPTIVLRARSDGTLLEIFEWISARAADEAHQNASLRAMWARLAAVADFVPLSAIHEAGRMFSHFEALEHVHPKPKTAAVKRRAPQHAKR